MSGSTHCRRASLPAKESALEMGKVDAQVNNCFIKALHKCRNTFLRYILLSFLHLFLENRKLIDLFAEVAKIGLGRQMSCFSTAFSRTFYTTVFQLF